MYLPGSSFFFPPPFLKIKSNSCPGWCGSVGQLVGRFPAHRKVTGSILGQGTGLGFGFGLQLRCVGEATNPCLSPSLSPSLSLSLKLEKSNSLRSLEFFLDWYPSLSYPEFVLLFILLVHFPPRSWVFLTRFSLQEHLLCEDTSFRSPGPTRCARNSLSPSGKSAAAQGDAGVYVCSGLRSTLTTGSPPLTASWTCLPAPDATSHPAASCSAGGP